VTVAQLIEAAAIAEKMADGRPHEVCSLGDLGRQGVMLRVGPPIGSGFSRSHWLIDPSGKSEERPW
jgi:hypothetical protein